MGFGEVITPQKVRDVSTFYNYCDLKWTKKLKNASCQNYVPQSTSHKKLTSRKINHLHSFVCYLRFYAVHIVVEFSLRKFANFLFFLVFNICKCKQKLIKCRSWAVSRSKVSALQPNKTWQNNRFWLFLSKNCMSYFSLKCLRWWIKLFSRCLPFIFKIVHNVFTNFCMKFCQTVMSKKKSLFLLMIFPILVSWKRRFFFSWYFQLL